MRSMEFELIPRRNGRLSPTNRVRFNTLSLGGIAIAPDYRVCRVNHMWLQGARKRFVDDTRRAADTPYVTEMYHATGDRTATIYEFAGGWVAYFAPDAADSAEAGELKGVDLECALGILQERRLASDAR